MPLPLARTHIHRVAIALGLSLAPLVAQAQRTSNAAPDRRSLLAQAQRARSQNNHSLALYFAEQAGRLQMTSSVRRFIAEEQLALGQLADAITSAEQCVREANAEPPSENHGIVLTGCQEMSRALRSRVASASITAITTVGDDVTLELNGQPLARESLQSAEGAQRWVAVGRQVLRARRAGFAPVEITREVTAGDTWTVRIVAARGAPRRSCAAASPSNTAAAGVDSLEIPGVAAPSDTQPRLWFDSLPFETTAGGSSRGAISIDGRPAAISSCPSPSTQRSTEITAGTHQVVISLEGHRSLERTITAREGEDLSMGAVQLEAVMETTHVPTATRTVVTRGWSPVGPIIGGVGVAALATSAALWFASDGAYASLRTRCVSSGCPGDAQAQSEAASIRTLDAASTGLVISGAVATAAGIALTFAIRPERTTVVPVSVSITHDRLVFSGRF